MLEKDMEQASSFTESKSSSRRNCLERYATCQKFLHTQLKVHRQWISHIFVVLVIGLSSSYLALSIRFSSIEGSIPLFVFAGLAVVFLVFYLVRDIRGDELITWYQDKIKWRWKKFWKIGRWVAYGLVAAGVITYLGVEVIPNNSEHLLSLCGIVFFIILSFFYSTNPSKIPWSTVYTGLVVQFVLGIVVLRWKAGSNAIDWISRQLSAFVGYGQVGARAMFGESFEEHSFAMSLMPNLVWFSGISNVLLYLGIIQVISTILGYILYFFIGTTPVEAFVAVSNIFLGPEGSMLIVRSILEDMSLSQLHACLACGLASIDAGLLPIFASFGVPARHLLTASCMSAPAALVVAKMIMPESKERPIYKLEYSRPEGINIIDVFQRAARNSVMIIASILVILLSFVSILAFVNTTVTWLGDRAGIDGLTLEGILGYIMMPVVFLMGVPWQDCNEVGRLIGTKTIINEFVAYLDLAELINNRKEGLEPSISIRSETIAAYALCGFSNFGTTGMMIGTISALVPKRKGDVPQIAMRFLISSSIACFMTGCMAGLLIQEGEEL